MAPKPSNPSRSPAISRSLATPQITGVADTSLAALRVMAGECIAAALTGVAVPVGRIVL